MLDAICVYYDHDGGNRHIFVDNLKKEMSECVGLAGSNGNLVREIWQEITP